jgi:predicted RNase H-like HicB family nuclease
MSREFNVIIERDSEGYFVASVPSLTGCHTQAKSLDELMERIREAIELCLEFEEDKAETMELRYEQTTEFDWTRSNCSFKQSRL